MPAHVRATLVIAVLLPLLASPARAGGPQDWIVTLRPGSGEPDAVARGLARGHGAELKRVYRLALSGFAARVPQAALERLAADPRVLSIAPDLPVGIAFHHGVRHGPRTPPPTTTTPTPTAQMLPSGVDRVEADAQTVTAIDEQPDLPDVDVAVIDTGIQLDHPELNVLGHVSFVPNVASGADDQGHGTFVAGVIGARDNTAGVVGVCPGAKLWAVKVLDSAGNGDLSDVIAGLEWVMDDTRHPPIRIVNMSLVTDLPLGSGSDPLYPAVQAAIAKGIVVVAAAGNESVDAVDTVPARYDEVICVSALADSDGRPGGLGPPTSSGLDDRFASFSSWGTVVDVIAPGVDITSTARGSGYAKGSGTSFAAPHVTGAVALYRLTHPFATPAEVRAGLLSLASAPLLGTWGAADPDGVPEPLLDVSRIEPGPPAVFVQASLDRATYLPGQHTTALLRASVSTETGTAIAGLLPTDFVVDLDGAAAAVTMTADSSPGLYRGEIALSTLLEGPHAVSVTATDGRGLSGAGQAGFTYSSTPGGGGGGGATAAGGTSGAGSGGGGGCTLARGPKPAGAAGATLPLLALALGLAAARRARPTRPARASGAASA